MRLYGRDESENKILAWYSLQVVAQLGCLPNRGWILLKTRWSEGSLWAREQRVHL